MRVIAGSAKGHKLFSVPGDTTRPITDRTKESLFNIISPEILGVEVLDLFAGTGSVGIEALSRGAEFVRFLDINKNAISTIRKNLQKTGFSDRAEVLNRNALTYIKGESDHRFDMVYIAPPQYKKMWIKTLDLLDENPGWIRNDGFIVVQIDPVEYHTLALKNFFETQHRDYGSTRLIFFSTKRRSG